jgi:hypothetical protein
VRKWIVSRFVTFCVTGRDVTLKEDHGDCPPPIEDNKTHPGTVKLVDATGELNVKHSENAQDIVLVPTPSGMSHLILGKQKCTYMELK